MDLYRRLDKQTYVIAEMSANHAGSLARAKEIIHAAKESGADCIKLQTYTPDTITIDCDNKYFQITDGTWKGENLYRLYEKAYMPWEWQGELKEEAEKAGIDFLSTPFDRTSGLGNSLKPIFPLLFCFSFLFHPPYSERKILIIFSKTIDICPKMCGRVW